MANFAIDTTNYSRLTGNQGTGTTLSLDTATGVFWCTEGTNTFNTDSDFWHRKRKFYLYDNNDNFRGEAVVEAKLTDDGTEERFALRPRVDANGNKCYFMNDLGESQDPSGTGKQAFTSTWEVDLTGCFDDIPNTTSGWTNTNSSLTRSVDGQTWTMTVTNDDVSSNDVADSACLIFGANTAGDQRGVAFFEYDKEIKIDFQTDSSNGVGNGPFRFAGGTTSFGICDNFQERKTSQSCLLLGGISSTDHTSDKVMYGFDTSHNSESDLGAVHMWYGGRMWGESSRMRVMGWENGASNSSGYDGNWAVSLVMETYINQDVYNNQQGNQAFRIATDTDQAALDMGSADRNWLRNCTMVSNAGNAIANRWRGNQEGGSISYYNVGDGSDEGPLSSFGYGPGTSGSAPQEVGGAGNTYLNVAQFSTLAADVNYTFLNRQGNAGYINFTNTNSIDRRGRSGAGSGNVVQTNTRLRFQYAGRWHNLAEDTKAYATYDTNLTGDNSLFGFTNNFARPLVSGEKYAAIADSNGNLDIRLTDAVHKASTSTIGNNSTDTYGYRYSTDGTDANDEATWAGTFSYSLKKWGYEDIVKTGIDRVDKYVDGVRVSSWEVSANVDTDSLGGGLTGGAVQEIDSNLLDADGNVIAQTWDGDPIGTTLANAETAMSAAVGTYDGTLNSNSGGYPNFDINGDGTGDIDFVIDDDGWNDSSNRTHITLDEIYAAMAYTYSQVDEDEGTGWNDAKHLKMPVRTVDSDGVWDLSTLDNGGVETDVTAVQLSVSGSGWDNSWQVSAKNSLIKGIKFDRAKGTHEGNFYALSDGIILESDVAGIGDSVTATWEDTTSATNTTTHLLDANATGASADNPIGAFTMIGVWELDIPDGRTADYDIYFDPNEQSNMHLYADLSDDDGNAQGQFKFNYGGSNTFNINLIGLSDAVLVQTGTNKAFRVAGTGADNVTISTVQESTLKFVGESGVTYAAGNIEFKLFESSDDGSTFTEITVADADWDFDTAGEFSTTIRHAHDSKLYFALHVYDSDGAVGAKSYYIQADQDFDGDRDYSLTPIVNITGTSSGLDTVTIDVTDGSADIDADDDDVVVTLDTTSTSTQTFQQTRYFLQNVVFKTADWLNAVAKGYIPATPITFQANDSVWTSFSDRFSIERATAGTAAALFLNDIPVTEGAEALWNSMTSGTAGKEIFFAPKTDGMSVTQLQTELNERLLTKDTVGNLGLSVPAWDEDNSSLYTTAKTS